MAQFKVDQRDLEFSLFEYLKIQDFTESFEEADMKSMLDELIKFTGNEIFPTREPSDLEGVKLTPEGVKVPECLHKAHKMYHENGWLGIGYPEELGGIPTPEAMKVACDSITTSANMAWMLYPGLSKAAANVISMVGSDEQKNLYVPTMLTGQWGGTMNLTEPDAGSDVGALKTMATKQDDGTYKLKGVKHFISSGDSDLYENIIHLVLARTPDAPEGTKGLSLFIVPKFMINDDNSVGALNDVACTKIEHKMGIHASATCELTFGTNDNCVGYLLGNELEGMKNMFIMMNEARLYCGNQGESQSSLAYELTLQYCRERAQFKKPIIEHPDVKRTLLKLRSMVRGMRALSMYTASLFDEHHRTNDEKVLGEIGFLTPVCKAFLTDEGTQVAIDCLQLHGGYGYCSEYGIEQFVRDVKISTIYEGTNAIQAIDFVTRKIMKDGGKTFMAFGEKIQGTLNKADDSIFTNKKYLAKSLAVAGQVGEMFGKKAAKGDIDNILYHATDFLTYCGNVITSWILLEHGILAQEKLANASTDDEKAYLQSKIDDFQVFAQHYLTRNLGTAKRILDIQDDIAQYNI